LDWPPSSLARRASAHGRRDAVALPYSLPRSIGALVVDHELGSAQLQPAWWSEHGEQAAVVARRVHLVHDWKQTMDITRSLVGVFAPLLAGVTLAELREVAQRSVAAHGRLPRPGVGDLFTIARARPDQLLERIRYASGDLSDAPLDEWQLKFGAEVRISTTRGGSWPASQDVAIASPGWSWGETRDRVLDRFAGGAGLSSEGAAQIAAIDGDADAHGWVGQLLS
jgi:hypothetical protein